MKLIRITSLLKRRTKQMLVDLLPEYKYSRITNQGVVILKSNKWSLRRTIINITDLYIDIFPKRLAEACKRKGYGDTYSRLFSNDIYVILQIKAYKKTIKIEDYMWDKYNILHREVPILTVTLETNTLLDVSKQYIPVLSPVSSYFIPGIETLIKRMKTKKTPVEKMIEKIKRIEIRSPQFLVRIGELQFA